MTPIMHLLLLPLLLSVTAGKDLEEKKGPFEDTKLEVSEGTPVPFALYQFQVSHPGVDDFRVKGEGREQIMISKDGWLYLEKPLDWSQQDHYIILVEALAAGEVVDGPIHVSIDVLDVNNNAPKFNQTVYAAVVRERNPAGVTFTQVFATDKDDPETANARLSYSLLSQIPNKNNFLLFQIDSQTGEISLTKQGETTLKARDGIQYERGEEHNTEALKAKFDSFCPAYKGSYDENPFFTCVEKAERRRWNIDPLEDPDYTLIVRVQDLDGESEKALTGSARVQVAVQQNLWINPGPITVREHLKETYPLVLKKVKSNNPEALYTLVQKERELKFPFQITEDGDILLTEELDREEKGMYILVVRATDSHGNNVDPPMEIQVVVEDINDNAPKCESEQAVFEVQENEPEGSPVGQLVALDADEEGTLNAQLTYSIVSSNPETFSIDATSGNIQTLRTLQRKDKKEYSLNIRVSDPAFSTECKILIKVIDVNNELPIFQELDYGSFNLDEDTPLGHTVVTIMAVDNDEPDSGSSVIEFHISSKQDEEVFRVETDGKGVGHVVIAKPLDFESFPTYNLKIDARNPEPLMKGLEYGMESTTLVSVSVTDVDEVPEFAMDILELSVPENTSKGSELLVVEAADPEGKEIGFKLEGDTHGWLHIDPATGQIKIKDKMDRETDETIKVKVIAFEKGNPEMSAERELSVRLLDVNDNVPKLIETKGFICVKKPEPILIQAEDRDEPPFSQPFTFVLGTGKKSSNWELKTIGGATAQLTLKKMPTEEKTFSLPINIKDNTGMGITQAFEVRVCNCTELGYCYQEPTQRGYTLGMGATVAILAGILVFCLLVFIIVIRHIKKGNQKRALSEEEEKDIMM